MTATPAPDTGAGGDATDPAVLAELVADAVAAHPSVVRLDGGAYGTVATHMPGRRLIGVRVGGPGEPVEVAVVLRLDRSIPDVVRSLRQTVRPLCGRSPVDVTVSDVVADGDGPDHGPSVAIGP